MLYMKVSELMTPFGRVNMLFDGREIYFDYN